MAHDKKQLFYEKISERLIDQIEKGTAPWQKPWKPGEFRAPHNPVSGTNYKGVNFTNLAGQQYADPRWCTYKQAQSKKWQVRKGEKGTQIVYWKFDKKEKAKDEKGKLLKDGDGKQIYNKKELDRPYACFSTVFAGSQVKGMPELEKKEIDWNPSEKAEKIIENSGATLKHTQRDRAFYNSSDDEIHLPSKESFKDANAYYAVALHELGHWTGHETRLNREVGKHPKGSEEYAKEELRAEIASLMISEKLGLGHNPEPHASYVENWVKALKDDPTEILRASRDAEKIAEYVIGLEMKKDQVHTITEKEYQDPHTLVEKRINSKYADILKIKRNPTGQIYEDIDDRKLTPEALEKHLSKTNKKELSEETNKIKSVIADGIGELIETYKYEGYAEGKEIENYQDKMLKVIELQRTTMQDKGAKTGPDTREKGRLSNDRGVTKAQPTAKEQLMKRRNKQKSFSRGISR